MPESKEHKMCKEQLAEITRCKKEAHIGPKRRADVACSPNLFFEVECKKVFGERICVIELRTKIVKREFVLRRLKCNELKALVEALSLRRNKLR